MSIEGALTEFSFVKVPHRTFPLCVFIVVSFLLIKWCPFNCAITLVQIQNYFLTVKSLLL